MTGRIGLRKVGMNTTYSFSDGTKYQDKFVWKLGSFDNCKLSSF